MVTFNPYKISDIHVFIKSDPMTNQSSGIGKCQGGPARHFGTSVIGIFGHKDGVIGRQLVDI